MPLEDYRKKRQFAQTPEPQGKSARRSKRKDAIFVIQKHDATSLHYDFRLEIDGFLASWAVPKGPSMNPAEKRLAIMTEDHPMEYAGFEGVIPAGHYGAGTVMVWDRGHYEVSGESPAATQRTQGEIKFVLHGVKLRGEFVLVHSGARSTDPGRAKQWLLIKHRDEHADYSFDIESQGFVTSVLTGRTMDEIEAGRPTRKKLARTRAGTS